VACLSPRQSASRLFTPCPLQTDDEPTGSYSGPEVILGEAHCRRMPSGSTFPRSPYLGSLDSCGTSYGSPTYRALTRALAGDATLSGYFTTSAIVFFAFASIVLFAF
jgi:hypothetical protein